MTKRVPSIPTEEELREIVRSWDPALAEDSPGFEAGLVMLAALYVGSANLARLHRVTGVPYHRVAGFAGNLRSAGIWTEDGKTHARWDEPGGRGEMSFWIDVGVARGVFMVEK